jgi:hypothetical protein
MPGSVKVRVKLGSLVVKPSLKAHPAQTTESPAFGSARTAEKRTLSGAGTPVDTQPVICFTFS